MAEFARENEKMDMKQEMMGTPLTSPPHTYNLFLSLSLSLSLSLALALALSLALAHALSLALALSLSLSLSLVRSLACLFSFHTERLTGKDCMCGGERLGSLFVSLSVCSPFLSLWLFRSLSRARARMHFLTLSLSPKPSTSF